MVHALDRFEDAQEATIDRALDELCKGRKQSHWMWFVFPQIAGLGHSPTARHFAISDVHEAQAYATHPVLGARLRLACSAVMSWAGRRSAQEIFGATDAMKLCSSMTLFEWACPDENIFAQVLDAYFSGKRDRRTRSILSAGVQHQE
ncbi:DUF1810 domain-containing protein [Croceicoccus sp. F390]|uniref:DUF1810 domain-containing protein n=1 Tax=Croceicoccus esteveae TaxID=3075597 RepID=A0ABU2ZEX2_9SPHN|nr:DUF1810 domain-containing protein [Croceicoccus sp. F390]MDT0574906.1 DUF1810 domain-containing protein [Croceicoccus sp. F390]